MSIPSRAETSKRLSGSSSVRDETVHFVLIQTIGTIDGDVDLAYFAWREPETEPSVLGHPVVVRRGPEAGVILVRAESVRMMAFVLPSGNKDVMFS